MPTDKTEAQRPTATSEVTAVESTTELSPEELAKVAGGYFKIELRDAHISSVEPPEPPPAKP
jgi:hypothetical protein